MRKLEQKRTEDVDETVSKNVSVNVGGFALDHHQVIRAAAVVLAYRRYRQSLVIGGKLKFSSIRRSTCLHTRAQTQSALSFLTSNKFSHTDYT